MKLFNVFFKPFPLYTGIIFTNYIFLFAFRLRELITYSGDALLQGLLGLTGDFVLLNAVLLLLFIPYLIVWKINPLVANISFTAATILFYLVGAVVQLYYSQTGELINTGNYDCSPVATLQFLISQISPLSIGFAFLSMIVAGILLYHLFYNQPTSGGMKWHDVLLLMVLILSFPIALHPEVSNQYFTENHTRTNKPFYFFHSMMHCQLGIETTSHTHLKGTNLFQSIRKKKKTVNPDKYPLVHAGEQDEECLSPYFKSTSNGNPPDIVLLMVEGLGDELIHPLNGVSYMPYLEQLQQNSLYWNEFLSPAQEGISPLPSILGGLPFGEKGFLEIDNTPYHYSLVNVLKNNGYHTSFFYGRWAREHSQEKFFTKNRLDYLLDARKFDPHYSKVLKENGGHWGYNDKDLFTEYFTHKDSFPQTPHFDIVYSSSLGSPFAIADDEIYQAKINDIITLTEDESQKQYLEEMRSQLKAFLYSNDAIEYFFNQFQNKPNYNNTIFIITGSYPIKGFLSSHPLKKYHVPLIIYSPLLKENKVFENISSHNDLYGTLINFLSGKYNLNIPTYSTSLGTSLCGASVSDANTFIPFITPEGQLEDIVYDGFFLSQATNLFTIGPGLEITAAVDEEMQLKMSQILDAFKTVNKTASTELMPDSLYFGYMNFDVLLDTIVPKSRVSGEYLKILDKMPIENIPYMIDVTLSKPQVDQDNIFVVYEIVDDADLIVKWKNFTIPVKNKDFGFTINLEKQETESQLYLRLYIWNESPMPYSFEKLRTTLYKKRIQNHAS